MHNVKKQNKMLDIFDKFIKEKELKKRFPYINWDEFGKDFIKDIAQITRIKGFVRVKYIPKNPYVKKEDDIFTKVREAVTFSPAGNIYVLLIHDLHLKKHIYMGVVLERSKILPAYQGIEFTEFYSPASSRKGFNPKILQEIGEIYLDHRRRTRDGKPLIKDE